MAGEVYPSVSYADSSPPRGALGAAEECRMSEISWRGGSGCGGLSGSLGGGAAAGAEAQQQDCGEEQGKDFFHKTVNLLVYPTM